MLKKTDATAVGWKQSKVDSLSATETRNPFEEVYILLPAMVWVAKTYTVRQFTQHTH